jgi:hypothetical protein
MDRAVEDFTKLQFHKALEYNAPVPFHIGNIRNLPYPETWILQQHEGYEINFTDTLIEICKTTVEFNLDCECVASWIENESDENINEQLQIYHRIESVLSPIGKQILQFFIVYQNFICHF